IPGNDDAARSIKLFCAMAADAVLAGRKAAAEASKAQEQQAEAAAAAEQAAQSPAAPAVEAPVQQEAPAAE
ncbi:MAG: 30S ribosomal protein S2, partial [Elusimicrobia bacterium]|nr:30S ribosomal protein S2 [Elusimicrobiota bacterium]